MSLLEIIRDPARRAHAAAEQDEERARRGRARTPAEANYHFGLARASLALQAEEVDPDFLAEGLALQGRFREAAGLATDEARRAEYEARAVALENAGVRLCGCGEVHVAPSRMDARGERTPMHHPVEDVHDGERTFRLYRCRGCGAISAEVKS